MHNRDATPPYVVLNAYRAEVVRYWERKRWVYLAILGAATLLAVMPALLEGFAQHRQHGMNWVFGTVVLAGCFVAANVCYSVVYLFEFVVMGTRLQEVFHGIRPIVLVAGCGFGALLAYGTATGLIWMLGADSF